MIWSHWRKRVNRSRKCNKQAKPIGPFLETLENRTVPTTLSLSIVPNTIVENAGAGAALGTVTRNNGDLTNPLTVNLSSSDVTEATVPAQVVIAAGDASATFSVDAVDDPSSDGSQTVQITATADGGASTTVGLDSSFGGGGYRTVPMQVSWSSNFPDVALQADGKIVAASDTSVSNAAWTVSRVLPDGTTDGQFGANGSVVTTFPGATDGQANGVVIQSDGKILVVGNINGGAGVHDDWAVARYNANGTLDGTFGSGGTVRIERVGAFGWLYDAKALANGSILLAGVWSEGMSVMRLTSSGQVDSTFATNGLFKVDLDPTASNNGIGYSLEVQPDGKIVVAGDPNGKGFGVIRLTANGALDTTFSGDGIHIIPNATFGSANGGTTYSIGRAASVKLQSDGKILLGGSVLDTNYNGNFAIARLNANGSLDTSFSGDGVAVVDFNGGDDLVNDMAVQADGKPILAGFGFLSPNGRELGLMRFNVDGSLDTTFDGDGKYTAPSLPSIFEAIWAAKLQPDGKLVALAGYNTDIRVGRFNVNNGSLSATASVVVTDDEPVPTLTVTINAANILEHAGNSAATGTVTRGNMSFASSLTVTLSSNDVSEATVPTQVVIPAGAASATFAINAVDDTATDGTQRVTITASAASPTAPGQGFLDVRDNEPFIAAADSYSVAEDSVLTIGAAAGVFANDTVSAPINPRVYIYSGAGRGTVVLNADGSFTYTPVANYYGNDSFVYRIYDGSAVSNLAAVNLTITPVNDAPVAVNDSYTVAEDQVLTVGQGSSTQGQTSISMVSDYGDWIGQGRTYNFSATSGTYSIGPYGTNGVSLYFYNPNTYWWFDFRAPTGQTMTVGTYLNAIRFNDASHPEIDITTDGRGSNQTTGQFTVKQIVFGPNNTVLRFAVEFEQHSEGGTPALRGTVYYNYLASDGVVVNDTDIENSPLTVSLVSAPAHGDLTLNANGTFTYAPHSNYSGPDSFTYKANDGQLDSNVATVSLTVTGVNDAPVAVKDAYSVNEDSSLTLTVPGVLLNDSDVEGDALTAALVGGPSHGTLTFNSDGSFTYTPTANYNGSDSFTYKINDGLLDSNVATVSLTITALNDPPIANAGPDQTANEGASVSFDGGASFDLDGDALTFTWNFGDGGTATGATPSHVFADNGTYIVLLTVDDGQGGGASDTLVVTVNNVAPTANVSGPATGVRGQARLFTFAATDASTADQGASFTYSIDWGDGATLMVNSAGSHVASHAFTATGAYTVKVTATDKDGGVSAITQQVVTIKAVDLQGGTLAIGGSTADDKIVVSVVDSQGNLNVNLNTVDQGTFAPPAQILVYGQAGNDTIQLASKKIRGTTYFVTAAAVLFGDAGNDSLDARGSTAANILVGGAGGDNLQGGAGRDILLGGLGADTVRSNGEDDIVIGAATDFDSSLDALIALMAEWRRTDINYQARVNNLNGTTAGGQNGGTFLNTATVHDDAAIDQLYGHAGQDWFFARTSGTNKDKVSDAAVGEIITLL